MKGNGFIKTATAVFETAVGDARRNALSIIDIMEHASKSEVRLLVLPELCLTGYTCQDLFLRNEITETAERELRRILAHMKRGTPITVLGMPVRNDGMLFNCAVVIADGNITAVIPKTYLPNYNEYYEKRWFASAHDAVSDEVTLLNQKVPFGTDIIMETHDGMRISCEICEDLWVNIPPSSRHTQYGANIVCNPSASNELVTKKEYRRDIVRIQSAKCNCAYLYSSAGSGESTADVVYGGHQMIASCGSIISEDSFMFGPGYIMTEGIIDIEKIENDRVRINSFRPEPGRKYRKIDAETSEPHPSPILPEHVNPYPFVPSDPGKLKERCREILDIQAAGLATRLRKSGIKKSVIGISGGLDSTLALLATARAYEMLGFPTAEDIIGITMPGFGTTAGTKNSACLLMDIIGTEKMTIDIREACRTHMKDIGHPEELHDVTYENIQARERTQILMDVANKTGGIVIGTGDLSEAALGWCTYNGDHMSMYAINASVPKTLVKFIISEYAESFAKPELARVLTDVCKTVISPELLPPDPEGHIAQSTEQTIGKYDLHDFFLYHSIRNGFGKKKLFDLAVIAFRGMDIPEKQIWETLEVFLSRFRLNQFKRNCMPDGPKVGTVALSPRGDWRMPSDMLP